MVVGPTCQLSSPSPSPLSFFSPLSSTDSRRPRGGCPCASLHHAGKLEALEVSGWAEVPAQVGLHERRLMHTANPETPAPPSPRRRRHGVLRISGGEGNHSDWRGSGRRRGERRRGGWAGIGERGRRERERRGGLTNELHRHVASTSAKPTARWPNMNGFNSWMAKDSSFCGSMVKIKLSQ